MHPQIKLQNLSEHFFDQSIKALLSLLLLALLVAIAAGIVRTFVEIAEAVPELFHGESLHESFRWILVDVLTVLAVIEVFRTVKAYFSEGRVKVTYIIDTVLVAVLTEVLAFWYMDIEPARLGMVIALVLALMFVRIFAIRFSPRSTRLSEGL